MRIHRFKLGLLWLAFCATELRGERPGYPPSEFIARREALCRQVGRGLILMFGGTMPQPGVRFRQDNDFYYLTGNEDLNAALVLGAENQEAHLFLPVQGEREVRADGWNWLHDPGAGRARGFTSIQPLPFLEEFLARRRSGGAESLYVRLSERDEVDNSRLDKAIHLARRIANPWAGQPSEDAYRVELLRSRYPYYQLKDVSPLLDRMRMLKSAREIEILRLNGRVSAEGIKRAIEISRPGVFEYELEAEAAYQMLRAGAEGNGYPAIVGSGPNVNIWHYQENGRKLGEGELVVMDYGASLNYLTVDITRTWPVSGNFDELQLRAYRCALEVQKAIIAAMRPGRTRAETREISRAIYARWGFADQEPAAAGHFVGMSVHDVGDPEAPFSPGMVIAVEPIIEIKERQLHIRIEDTVLITATEPEVLSAAVPKEVEELLALVGKRKAEPVALDSGGLPR